MPLFWRYVKAYGMMVQLNVNFSYIIETENTFKKLYAFYTHFLKKTLLIRENVRKKQYFYIMIHYPFHPCHSTGGKNDRLDQPSCWWVLRIKVVIQLLPWWRNHQYKRYWYAISDSIDLTKRVGVAAGLNWTSTQHRAKFKSTGFVDMMM